MITSRYVLIQMKIIYKKKTISLDTKLIHKLKEVAKKEDRTHSAVISRALERYFGVMKSGR